jgi:uncharacterized protein (DUF427 family)
VTPAGTSQIEAGPLIFEESPRWVRAEAGGVTVADSKKPLLLWEVGKVLPVYLFPRDDVRADLLRPSENPIPEAHHGLASYFTLEVDGRVAENGAWSYSSVPGPEGERLADHVAFEWEAMDAWYEEEERIIAHPRDPYHRVDTRESSRHVRVELGGETLAKTARPRLVFETGLPTRYYLPREDVWTALLAPSETRTLCAYKGEAHYWSTSVGGEAYEDVAWSYPEPLPDNPQIRGLVCFLNERADIYVDGERLERPTTQWSGGFRSNVRGGGSGTEQGPHGPE